jgi:hypothetical protein
MRILARSKDWQHPLNTEKFRLAKIVQDKYAKFVDNDEVVELKDLEYFSLNSKDVKVPELYTLVKNSDNFDFEIKMPSKKKNGLEYDLKSKKIFRKINDINIDDWDGCDDWYDIHFDESILKILKHHSFDIKIKNKS